MSDYDRMREAVKLMHSSSIAALLNKLAEGVREGRLLRSEMAVYLEEAAARLDPETHELKMRVLQGYDAERDSL